MGLTVRHLESTGSFWEFDEDLMRYRRWPKDEKPRENGHGTEPGPLHDAEWHEMTTWGAHSMRPILVIGLPEDDHVVRAPLDIDLWLALLQEGRVWANPREEN